MDTENNKIQVTFEGEKLSRFIGSGEHTGLLQAVKRISEAKYTPATPLNEAQKLLIDWKQGELDAALLWVVKFQTGVFRKKEFPFNTPYFKTLEAWGRFFNSLLQLCKDITDLADEIDPSLPIDDAIDRWAIIALGIKFATLEAQFAPDESRATHEAKCRSQIKKLSKFELPDGDALDLQDELHAFAISLAKHNPTDQNQIRQAKSCFRSGIWQQYLKDCLIWASSKGHDSRMRRIYEKNNKVYLNPTGRQTICIWPDWESFLKQKRTQKIIKMPTI